MEEDLNLRDGSRYSIILMLFFPSYFLTDIPSNWTLVRVSPRLWLAFLMFAWGAILVGVAFTHDWQVMAFLRFPLGAFEGGVLLDVTFVIACWCVLSSCFATIRCTHLPVGTLGRSSTSGYHAPMVLDLFHQLSRALSPMA